MADTAKTRAGRGKGGDGKREGKGGREGAKREGGKGDRPPRERKPREELPTVEDPKAELDKVMASGAPPKPNRGTMDAEILVIQQQIDAGKARADAITKELDEIKEKNERQKLAGAAPMAKTREELAAVKKEIVGTIEARKRISAQIDEIRDKKGAQDEAIKKQKAFIGKFSSNDSIDQEIARIEEHMAHTSLSIKQEKDYIATIKELNKKRDDVKKLEIMEGKRGAGAGQLSLTDLFEKRKQVDEKMTALRATEKAGKDKLDALREKSQSKDPDRFPMLRDERAKIRNENKERIDEIREKNLQYKKLEDAWYAHDRLIKNLKWQLRVKQTAEREEREKERAEKRSAEGGDGVAGEEEAEEGEKKEKMMDWDLADRITKIEQLIKFLEQFIPKEATKEEAAKPTEVEGAFHRNAKLEDDPLGLNALMVDEVVSKRKGKKDKKKKANAAKNDVLELIAGGESVPINLSFEMIQNFGSMSLPVPVDSDDAAGSITQLKEKLVYYNEQGTAGLTLKEVIKAEKAARSKKGKPDKKESVFSSDGEAPSKDKLKEEAQKIFEDADVNGDGVLSKSEIKKYMNKVEPELKGHFGVTSGGWKLLWDEMDANGDGEMNIFEWEAMYISKMGLKETVKKVATAKGSFAAPTGGPKKGKDKELTQEEKKARGLLYDVSKAKAVRDDDSDDDEGPQVPVVSISVDGGAPVVTVTLASGGGESADFAGGDPFEGL